MGRSVERAWSFAILAIVAYFGLRSIGSRVGPLGVAAVVAAGVLMPLVLGPIVIHRNHWSSLDPILIPFDPDGPGSPEELRSSFAESAEELGHLGFTPERFYQTKRATTNADGSVLLFRNEKTRETAKMLTAVGVQGNTRIVSFLAAFSSVFSDGTEVVTSNRRTARIYPPRKPPFYGRAFPQVREVGRLLDVHRARVENLAAGKLPMDPVGGDPDGYIRRVEFEAPHAHHVACGYSYVDEMARVQRMTWKGAILVTWKLLPPIKQIRLGWDRLSAARQLGNFQSGRPVS